ncbi:hypothetical protein DFH07DRAFT_735350, partial [Mycena maculata]
YASYAQRSIRDLLIAPLPTFFMDDFMFYTDHDGWIELNVCQLVDTVMIQNTVDTLAIANPQGMLTSIYNHRPPPDFPYIHAYSTYSTTIQLYARSGQLATVHTLYLWKKLDSDQCPFRCDMVEDMHHVLVECTWYMDWREKAAKELVMETEAKLNEKSIGEAAQKHLLTTAKSLFTRNVNSWPLKHSFYYLGHIPPLEPLLLVETPENDLTREQLLHHLVAE